VQDRNVDVAREAFAAFAARDLERLGRTLAEDVSWHTPGTNLLAGDYYGRSAVLGYLRRVLELSGGTQQVVPVDVLVGRDHVAAVVDLSGQRRGLVLRDRAVQLLAFRAGLIVMRRVYPADQAAFDRFWAP
jgi:uncharacterized protein